MKTVPSVYTLLTNTIYTSYSTHVAEGTVFRIHMVCTYYIYTYVYVYCMFICANACLILFTKCAETCPQPFKDHRLCPRGAVFPILWQRSKTVFAETVI